MRLLFSVGSFGFVRNFEPALRLLAERGHEVHLVADRRDNVGGMRLVEALERDYPARVTHQYADRGSSPWHPLASAARLTLDYWRYLDARYDHSPSLRARAERQAPALARRLAAWLGGSPSTIRLLSRAVAWLERAMPAAGSAHRLLADRQPDLLLLTPLLYFGSQQVDYVRAARARGTRTVLGVGSWDHLTTKGLIHEAPDHVLVWNEMQRQEAAELHGIDPARVIVTGAQAYDQWFTARPSAPRGEFCRRVGLPDDRPLLLYLCSSPFITPHEVGFVRRWIEGVRGSADAEVRRAAILIRPHPQNAEQWDAFDERAFEAVAVWPKGGANPLDRTTRADYFDSMYYSAAVVGVNTSALIESGIVGRPVLTILADDFAGQQEGTLHFQHLKNVNGGLLQVGRDVDEHVEQVARTLQGQYDPAKGRAFVEAFVRPHGLDVPAAQRVVDALESCAAAPRPAPQRASVSTAVRRLALWPLARAAHAAALSRQRRNAQPAARTVKRPGEPLRILFAVASPEYLRYYDSTMKLLADRGHQVALSVNSLRERKHARLDLIDDTRIEIAGVVPERQDVWLPLARAIRGTMDFVRYLDPRFADTPILRNRMYRKVLPSWLRPLDWIPSMSSPAVNRLLRALQACERALPVSGAMSAFLEAQAPDALVVSPLIDAASDQVDAVRAARRAALPVMAAIASWDNLTNKGHIRVEPDAVAVWNERQKTEAVELHGVQPDRVVVTGAQLFDHWFERRPSMSRADFCRMVGLPDERPFVLFTGSSVFIARSEHEVPFVRTWIEGMRASADPMLRDAAVLVRPHPFNPEAWTTADLSDLGPVAIWPRARYTPAAEDARASLFDSLYHCQAVVGINTSAMIEAAILGKPVLSLLSDRFAGTQDGTLHFRYLRPENGGFVRVANTVGEHVQQLATVLRDPALVRTETDRFVASFLRPHGVGTPCTPILADAIQRVATTQPVADARAGSRLLRAVLWPLAVVLWLTAPPADAAAPRQDTPGQAARAAWHRASRRMSRVAHRARTDLGKVPRRVLRQLRFARYYVATAINRSFRT
jgi:predicted glycosyltransferase